MVNMVITGQHGHHHGHHDHHHGHHGLTCFSSRDLVSLKGGIWSIVTRVQSPPSTIVWGQCDNLKSDLQLKFKSKSTRVSGHCMTIYKVLNFNFLPFLIEETGTYEVLHHSVCESLKIKEDVRFGILKQGLLGTWAMGTFQHGCKGLPENMQ